MKLLIPQQAEIGNSALPIHPRKAKKWLADLPQANMGEMTKQIFGLIRELNRKKIPAKHRLEIMEMLRPPCRGIFDNLKKYFVNRTFPLPEKSRKIVNLNQALLLEMALGYKIIAQQAADKIEKVDNKTQAIAIARAIKYQSELLLRASEIYVSVPVNVWRDVHQMFAYAVNLKVHQNIIEDSEHPHKKTCIEDLYKQMLLFSLSRPTALRQSDSQRVYNKLYQWTSHTKLGTHIQENQIDRFFCVRSEEDRPPSYLNPQDFASGVGIFTLETTELVDNIRKQINNSDNQDAITVGEELSVETLKALTLSWGVMPKRRFSRAGKRGNIAAAIGLKHATRMIREGNLPEAVESVHNAFDRGDGFTLEHIPDELKSMHEKTTVYMTHTATSDASSNAWDMVAKGRAMTDSFERQRALQAAADSLILNKEDEDLHWEVVNISAGGYCLRWNSETTSKAQIGELIAIREQDAGGNNEWRIGSIRWMQLRATTGLEIGVQILSPKVVATVAHRIKRPEDPPFDALMVPGIKPLNQPATIILPAHAFKTGDRIKVDVFDQSIDIKLGDRKEHTGLFTQFLFIHLDQHTQQKKVEKQEEASKKRDDFDEIWSSL